MPKPSLEEDYLTIPNKNPHWLAIKYTRYKLSFQVAKELMPFNLKISALHMGYSFNLADNSLATYVPMKPRINVCTAQPIVSPLYLALAWPLSTLTSSLERNSQFGLCVIMQP